MLSDFSPGVNKKSQRLFNISSCSIYIEQFILFISDHKSETHMDPVDKIYHSNKCIVCYEDFEKKQANACLLLKCGHVFHQSCIKPWIEKKQSCPLCKSKAFIPILLKDIVNKGIKGIIDSAQLITVIVLSALGIGVATTISHYIIPGRRESDQKAMETLTAKHGVLFDFNKPEGFIRLGITLTAILGLGCSYYVTKTLIQRRNQPAAVAKQIKYIPPDQT